jgi:hypothetical protein
MNYETTSSELDSLTSYVDALEAEIRYGSLETRPLDLAVARISLTALAAILDERLASREAYELPVDQIA